ncbi:MAG: hypothetical protein ACHQAY_09685 [Hyphomicrobiales bacterium]
MAKHRTIKAEDFVWSSGSDFITLEAAGQGELSLSYDDLFALASTARRKLRGRQVEERRGPDFHDGAHELFYAEMKAPSGIVVGPTPIPAGYEIALAFDRETDEEIAYRLSLSQARQLRLDSRESTEMGEFGTETSRAQLT